MDYKVSANLLQDIVNYLQTRPYVDVHILLGTILKLQPLGPAEEVPQEAEKPAEEAVEAPVAPESAPEQA